MKITLKDGSVISAKKGVTAYDIALQISEGLARNALAAKIDGKAADLSTVLNADCSLEILTFKDEEGKEVYRHTASHVLAQAVKRLFPDAKLAIGPATKDGFYYDFDFAKPVTIADFEKIEKEMQNIIKANLPIQRTEVSRKQALDKMRALDEPYKIQLVEELPDEAKITLYTQGEFCDLCRGPHLTSTGKIKCFKLTSIAGAYWKGNEKNKMLTRIYATAFDKKSEMDAYFQMLEEAKKRDHTKLGKELGIFALMNEGKGFPFFLPKGMALKNALVDYWRDLHAKEGYSEIQTPIILNRTLWENSGHWDHYRDNMYTTLIDEDESCVKPMNCPGCMLVYKLEPHSYKDLPLRMAEMGLVHRHEKSGQLHGLFRVRCFTQDDAHIFMLPSQIAEEIKRVIRLTDKIYSQFGFKYKVELSTRPENSMGSEEDWDLATSALKEALDEMGLAYEINEGDGAFYGPKIDFHLQDSIGRTWQCGTIQLDFQMPQRFELEYVGEDGRKHRPIMIHRAIFGSIERFIGILIEHFAGNFPLWLAPQQVKILPITDRALEYARALESKLKDENIRCEVDARNEKIGYKIREAQLEKVPYMIVVGDKESENGSISLRSRKDGDLGTMSFDEFLKKVEKEISEKID